MEIESFDTIVIGGSQAGLTAGYYLAKQGREFLILEANQNVGDAWRNRWDSLRLFTPVKFCRLPGMKLPESAGPYPTKDAMADYLEAYAARFQLPVRTGIEVDGLSKRDGWFVISAGSRRLEARNVIVATGAHRVPKVPDFAAELDSRIVQLHSSEYRNPSQIADGDVLVVGAGNSGAEIAVELAAHHRCVLAAGIHGVVAVAGAPGVSWENAAGVADLESGAPVTPAHRFRIASATKLFVAALVLQLVEEGALALDGEVDLIAGDVTVRHLLNHTSGLPNYAELDEILEPYRKDLAHRSGLTPRDVLALVESRPRLFSPGEGWSYSGSNYVVLGLLVEEITGATPTRLGSRHRIRQSPARSRRDA